MRWKCHGSVQATGNSPGPSLSPPLEQSGNQTRWADNSDQYVGFEIGSACCDNTSEWFPTQTDCLLVRTLTQFTEAFAADAQVGTFTRHKRLVWLLACKQKLR